MSNENSNSEKFCTYVGSIKFSESENNSKHIGVCTISVYSSDGNIPHFHIFNDDHSFECCVQIYENAFFGTKYKDRLTTIQCKELNEWMKRQDYANIVGRKITNWEVIKLIWGTGCDVNCTYPESKKTEVQPHYEDMH